MERTAQIYRLLKQFFGFDAFKDNQLEIINSILDGHDTFVLMPTGGGKSLCYQLPALISEGTAIIVSPLIALMKNQVDAVRACSERPAIAHFMNSSLSRSQLEQVHKDLLSGETKMLYVAPESLSRQDNIDLLQQVPISFYAVDEAHCISEWGHDFRPEYRKLRETVLSIQDRPIIALTATATPVVQKDIQKCLGMEDANVFTSSFNRPNLYYEVRHKDEKVDRDIIRFIKSHEGESGIVYCMSRKQVEDFSEVLCANEIKALPYHAGLDSALRDSTQDAFLRQDIDVIVATIAFGMGIDKPDVRFVVHYDIPKSLESYYQETGRAGRDGGEGRCIAYYNEEDITKMKKLLQSKNKTPNERLVGRQLIEEMEEYARSPLCRRSFLLYYFGEQFGEDNCHNCDNCKVNNKTVDAKDTLVNVLEAVQALKEGFKSDYVVQFLRGKKTADIENYQHHELETFGSCKDEEAEILETVIRQALIEGYLDKDMESYGLLKLTAKGKKFIKKPTKFQIIIADEADEEPQEENKGGGAGVADPALYLMLQKLRKSVAAKLDLPPYVIFQESSLQDMATLYPINIEELQNISGVGQSKAKKYGEPFVKMISQYVAENEVERPEDIRIRTLPNKSKLKVAIVQMIDRKVSFEDIAYTHDLDFDELLTEIEAIVYSGTKINITYFVNDVMDEEQIEEIYDYFRNSDTDDLETAISALGEYEEAEIRLVRIKFLSELAN